MSLEMTQRFQVLKRIVSSAAPEFTLKTVSAESSYMDRERKLIAVPEREGFLVAVADAMFCVGLLLAESGKIRSYAAPSFSRALVAHKVDLAAAKWAKTTVRLFFHWLDQTELEGRIDDLVRSAEEWADELDGRPADPV